MFVLFLVKLLKNIVLPCIYGLLGVVVALCVVSGSVLGLGYIGSFIWDVPIDKLGTIILVVLIIIGLCGFLSVIGFGTIKKLWREAKWETRSDGESNIDMFVKEVVKNKVIK